MDKIIVKKPTAAEKEKAKKWPVWEHEPGNFPWEYKEKETCLIIEGKAVAHTDSGDFEFGKGDWVVFPKGLSCTWAIEESIKKHYKFG